MLRAASALLLIAGTAAIGASAPVQPQTTPVDVQLRQARAEAAAAGAEQQRLEKAAKEAGDEVTRLRAQQLAAAQAIDAAEADITAAEAAARLIQMHLAAQKQRLAAEQAPMSSLLAGLILAARRPPVLFLADSGSAEDLVKLRLLVSATGPAIAAKATALSRQVHADELLQRQALAARNAILESRAELRRRRDQFAALEQRATQMAASRGSEAMGAGDLALASEEHLSSVEESAQSARSSRQLAGELAALGPAPLQSLDRAPAAPLRYRLPADAAVTDGFAAVSASGVRSRGTVLATRRGSPVVAPASGTVLFAGPFRDYDGVVIIDHGGGWKSVIVNAGSKLQKGTTVRMGENLGVALGPIQVQLLHGGEAVSPALIARSSAMLSNPRKGG